MPGFLKKTLSFLGFIDEEKEENIPQRYSDNRRISRAINESKYGNKLSKINEIEKNEIMQNTQTSWFRTQRKISKLEEVKVEKKTKVFVIEPDGYEDSQTIGDKFKSDIPVIVNLQSENPEIAKRIIDFCSGLTYALNGSIEKVADKVFLITPYNVEVSSSEKEMLRDKGLYDNY